MSRGTEPRRVIAFWFSFLLLQPARETDCYPCPDSNDRRTLVDAALSIGNLEQQPKARVLCLWNESSSPDLSGLFVLLTVEAFPVAGGLLRGSRRWRKLSVH